MINVNEFNGLPTHILLIHLVVIAVPLAAVITVVSVLWPAARRRLGVTTPIVALLALVCVPITTHAGTWLQARVFHGFSNPLIVRHAQLGDQLLPWTAGLFLLAALVWGLPVLAARSGSAPALGSVGVRIAVGVLAVAVAVVATVQVYRIGDSGAKAAWSSNFCAQPYVGDTCPTT
ncbi:DUF2231 domain-containing protein [Nakamurella panacisegetis]